MKQVCKSTRFERVMHAIFAPCFRVLLSVRAKGKENIPTDGSGYVICSNHVALWDPVAISAVFPRRRMPRYLSKAELFKIPVLRTLLRALGAIPLERRGSDVKAIRRAIALAKDGEFLTVFPQGTRRKGLNPADTPIKPGAAMIAAHAGVPILPVCIRMKKQKYAFLRRVEVLIGKPISPEELGLTKEDPDYRAAAERAFAEVLALGGFTPGGLLPGAKKA